MKRNDGTFEEQYQTAIFFDWLSIFTRNVALFEIQLGADLNVLAAGDFSNDTRLDVAVANSVSNRNPKQNVFVHFVYSSIVHVYTPFS
jgi:hypothetical protein